MAKESVIVDVDGTLAEFQPDRVKDWVLGDEKHWDPFFEFMASAKPIEPVRKLVQILKEQGQSILICSGRPDSHRQQTIDWLTKNNIPFDDIFLRPIGDDALKDEVVKGNLLKVMREKGYTPWLVLDDRDSVVKQWRDLNLTCLQCAPGDF